MPDSLRNMLMILTPIFLMILIAVISVILDIDISSIPRIILIPGFFILEVFVLELLGKWKWHLPVGKSISNMSLPHNGGNSAYMKCGILKASDQICILCIIRCCTQMGLLYIYSGELCSDSTNGPSSAASSAVVRNGRCLAALRHNFGNIICLGPFFAQWIEGPDLPGSK